MCGICGSLAFNDAAVERDLVERMIATIRHRGPDGFGVHTDGPVGLGHARLSIIDLVGGAQPMRLADQPFWITFNGEIFNYIELRDDLIKKGHRFATRSDTEVILHLYAEEGDRCVQRLNGQWAFAIWDGTRRRLFLSRDRMGVRPLFYTVTPDRFVFASEIKALFADSGIGRELDLQGLDQILTFWVTLPPRTAFRDVRELPPGHSLVVEDGNVRVWSHWQLEYAPHTDCSEHAEKRLTEEFLALLLDATRIRLRADVPVGAYLSGGLDSTLISALAKGLVGDRLRTFSVSFDDPEFDESRYQRDAVAFLDTRHSDVRCGYDDIARSFPGVVRHAEQPIVRTSPAPLLLLAGLVRNSGYKVVLTGEGADETMGGYDIFKEAKIRRFWARQPGSTRRPLLLKRLYPYLHDLQRQSPAYLQRFFHATTEDLANPFFSHLPRWALTARVKTFLSDSVRAEMEPHAAHAELERVLPSSFGTWNTLNQAEYLEARYLLPGFILSSQGDRMAMAHGIEGRYPFLDHRVVAFAAALPPRLKLKVLDQKYLLKQVAHGLVPESVRTRPKQPYRAPDGKSFFGPSGRYVEDVLCPDTVRRHGIFDPRAVGALLAKFAGGRATSTVDNMAFVAILSTALLFETFVRGHDTSVFGSGTTACPVTASTGC